MPLLKDKQFEKAPLPNGLLQDEEVFHCVITNEIFRDYDEFCQRIILCNSMVWTCEYTEKTGLTYLEALESEKQAQESFKDLSTELRIVVLFLASKTHRNSFTEMADDVYTYMKDRFFIGENVEASFTNNKWKESHVLQVIAPTEKQLKALPKNGHANDKHFYPPSSLYSYEVEQLDVEDQDSSHIMIVNIDQIKRKRKLTRDKIKFFLKQYITQNENFVYVIKEQILQAFSISTMNFNQIFDGPLPNFGFSKQKNKKQKFITEFLTENQNGVLLEKLGKLRKQEEVSKQEKIAEKLKQREENLKISAMLKEWYVPKEDLELEDHKMLPVPAPVQSTVPEQYLGDMIAVLEFSHTLSKLIRTKLYFPNELTFDLIERALTQREVNGPLTDIIQMFLATIFDLQNMEKPLVYTRVDASGDDKVKDVNGNISLTEATYLAAKAASWSQEHHGIPLNKLPLYSLTTTEILRLHLLSSGARLTDYASRMRFQARGGYMSEDDPALHLRLKYPHIIRALALHNINNLPIGDKLKIIHCLMNQILTYSNVRDQVEDNLEKSRQAKFDLKLHSSVERKLEQEYNADKAKIINMNINVTWNLEKLDKEYEKKRNQNVREFKSLQKMASKHQNLLGQDRAFRKYFKFESIPGVFVSMEDDPGICFDESVKQIPHLVGADKSVVLAHIRKLYDEMNNSDKENVENKDIQIIESDEPIKVNGIHNSLIEESSNLLLCSADSEKCPVHSVNMKQKWSFFYENKQIDELIGSLNERGIRESELKQTIINDREDLISTVNQTPVSNLNPYLQTESESRLRPRRSAGKAKYDDPNFGFAEETDPLTVLQSVLTGKVLETEASIYSGTIGLLDVQDRDKWREMLSTRDFENFVKTYQISNTNKNRKDEGSNSRPPTPTPNVVKEHKDPGQFLSSSIQIDCDDVDYNKLLVLNEEHKWAIQALSVALVQVGRSLEQQYLRKPLGQIANGKNDKTSKGGLLAKWEQSLLLASSYDQVFLHYATLNKCIFWSRSALLTKCQVCRKQSNGESMILCDSCNKGQHLFCFRPKLKVVPKDSWYCKDCEKEIEKETKLDEVETRSSRWKKIVDPDTSEESENDIEEEVEEEEEEEVEEEVEEVEETKAQGEQTEESKPEKEPPVEINTESDGKEECTTTYKIIHSESEEYSDEESGSFDENDICTKCKTGGTLLCCDECPDMFHVECAEPPLRRVPRGKWFCHHCKLKMAYLLGSRSGSEDGFSRRSKRREIDRRDDLPLHNAPLQEVLADVLKHEYAWPFIRPVVKNEVPDYYDIITKPMDFGTIKYKLNMGEYKCDADLMDDAALVFDNCNTYNSKDDEVYHCGAKLLKYFVNKCHERGLKVSAKLENEISSPSKPKKLCVN